MAITSTALAFASRWFDEATVRRTFEPLVADWQREWQDAPPSGRTSVSIRGLAAFLCAVIVSTPSLLRITAPPAVTNRVAVRITRFVAVVTFLQMIPFFREMRDAGWNGLMLFFMVPSVIVLAFPFSMIGAIDAIRRHEPLAPHVERAVAAKLAIIALLFMIVFGGWVVPAANQAFRIAASPQQAPVPGVRELTTYQLIMSPELAARHEPYTGGADRATRIQRELNNRAVLAVVPLLILWVRWRAIENGRGAWWSPLPAPLAAVVLLAVFITACFSGWRLEHELNLPAGAGYWLGVIALAFWGTTESRLIPQLRHLRYLKYLRHPRF